jgi:RNA 2',3'-cyclic 3'-phosphodiesterase
VGNATPLKSQRLFFAVWPDEATSQKLAGLQSRVRGRKTHHDDFHITLAFLGQRPVDSLPILKEILARLDPIDMTLVLDRLGYFRHNRIAWIGMETPPPALFQLRDRLCRELTGRSIPFSGVGDFMPHITLARNADAPDEEPFAPIAWHARRIALAESAPASEGARYRLLAEVRAG